MRVVMHGLGAHVADGESVNRFPLHAGRAHAGCARALVERLDLTGAGAAVTADGVVVVALFEAANHAVAARLRGAGAAGRRCRGDVDRALPARLDFANARTTVVVDLVAVVAGLGAFDFAVVAGGGHA